MKKNKGYTLIEVIIVLAIMAILSGLAAVTIGIINNAKHNAAVTSLDNQMGSLWIKTKALSQGKVQTTPTAATEKATYPMCMQILHNADGTYSIIFGYDTGAAFIPGDTGTIAEVEAGGQSVDKAGNNATGLQATLPKIVSVTYEPSTGARKPSFATDDAMIIEFIKSDGSVKYGAGTYKIVCKNGSTMSVYLDAITGNHYIK